MIVPTYNQMDYAEVAVASALRSHPQILVMLVDDGSPTWNPKQWEKFPPHRLLTHRFEKNDRNLTRSWNWGLVEARRLGIPYAVPTNSDVKFPLLWWEAMEAVLSKGAVALAGPVTNAPGHRPRQQVKGLVKGYEVRDDKSYLDQVSRRLYEDHKGVAWTPNRVNGFCLAARTETWWQGAHGRDHVFDPGAKFKLTKNEDELEGRWMKKGLTIGIVPGSFVFHYRGVSRGAKGKGRHRMKS